jgi:hypothetical protein
MKNWFLSAFLLLFACGYSDDFEENSWKILKNHPSASTFMIKQGEALVGRVERTGRCTPRYQYDLYDTNNTLQMRGITRAFSLGAFFAWGMEIDLYEGDATVGLIQGQCCTKARARFNFYDAKGEAVAIAYLDNGATNFFIFSAQHEGLPLVELRGKVYGDGSIWEMQFSNLPPNIDLRALLVFAGFVADYDTSFVAPRQDIIYYPAPPIPAPPIYFYSPPIYLPY